MRDTLRTCRLLLDTEWEVNSWWKVIIEIRIENIKTLMMAEIVNLQGVGCPGTQLMFKFRSGTNALNKELGRHRGKNDDGHDKLTWLEASSVCTCYNR